MIDISDIYSQDDDMKGPINRCSQPRFYTRDRDVNEASMINSGLGWHHRL